MFIGEQTSLCSTKTIYIKHLSTTLTKTFVEKAQFDGLSFTITAIFQLLIPARVKTLNCGSVIKTLTRRPQISKGHLDILFFVKKLQKNERPKKKFWRKGRRSETIHPTSLLKQKEYRLQLKF